MRRFDRVIIADWSAAAVPSPRRPAPDAIWLGIADDAGTRTQYHRTRASAEAQLTAEINAAQRLGQRLLIGCDFPFGYPRGFAAALTGRPTARAVWDYLEQAIVDGTSNANNRFALADAMNARFGGRFGAGPFWGRPAKGGWPHLPARKDVDYSALPFAERREVDRRLPSAQPVWKLFTTGSVGSQCLMGLPMIARLARRGGVTVWPFDDTLSDVVLAEVYPSLLAPMVAQHMAQFGPSAIKDQVQVVLLARALWAQPDAIWARMLALPHEDAREEGWILGLGHVPLLAAKAVA